MASPLIRWGLVFLACPIPLDEEGYEPLGEGFDHVGVILVEGMIDAGRGEGARATGDA